MLKLCIIAIFVGCFAGSLSFAQSDPAASNSTTLTAQAPARAPQPETGQSDMAPVNPQAQEFPPLPENRTIAPRQEPATPPQQPAQETFAPPPRENAPEPETLPQSAQGQDQPPVSDRLEELVGPIALYPDVLLAQILAASTYPLDIVEADRYLKANNNDTSKIEQQKWDPSVKAVARYPKVISMMSDKLGWTRQLGEAVLANQSEVMDAVQRMRAKARQIGTLTTDEQQKVEQQGNTIVIQPSNPQYIYVPVYTPQAYGSSYSGYGYNGYNDYPYYDYPYFDDYYNYDDRYYRYNRLRYWPRAAVGGWLDMDCDWNGRGLYYGGWGWKNGYCNDEFFYKRHYGRYGFEYRRWGPWGSYRYRYQPWIPVGQYASFQGIGRRWGGRDGNNGDRGGDQGRRDGDRRGGRGDDRGVRDGGRDSRGGIDFAQRGDTNFAQRGGREFVRGGDSSFSGNQFRSNRVSAPSRVDPAAVRQELGRRGMGVRSGDSVNRAARNNRSFVANSGIERQIARTYASPPGERSMARNYARSPIRSQASFGGRDLAMGRTSGRDLIGRGFDSRRQYRDDTAGPREARRQFGILNRGGGGNYRRGDIVGGNSILRSRAGGPRGDSFVAPRSRAGGGGSVIGAGRGGGNFSRGSVISGSRGFSGGRGAAGISSRGFSGGGRGGAVMRSGGSGGGFGRGTVGMRGGGRGGRGGGRG